MEPETTSSPVDVSSALQPPTARAPLRRRPAPAPALREQERPAAPEERRQEDKDGDQVMEAADAEVSARVTVGVVQCGI